jgi:hypothetical protein
MNIKVGVLLLLLLSSCYSEEKVDWKIDELYEVKDVSIVETEDTIEIEYIDESYIFFDEYCKWKTDFFIFLNQSKIEGSKVYKITNNNNGKEGKTYIYNPSDIREVKNLYEKNEMFRNITYDIFNELTISEISNLVQANFSLNQYSKEYSGNLSDLMYDYTMCDDSCFAIDRLKFMGEMLNEVQLEHFWHNEVRIAPCHLVKWMNELPNGQIEVDAKLYCKQGLIPKSKEMLSFLKKRDLEQIRLAFYSNNYFNEVSFGGEILKRYQDDLKDLVIEDEEIVMTEDVRLSVNSKYIKADSLDVTNIVLPISSEINSGNIKKFLVQTYVFHEGEYKLIGLRLNEAGKQKKIYKKDKKEI